MQHKYYFHVKTIFSTEPSDDNSTNFESSHSHYRREAGALVNSAVIDITSELNNIAEITLPSEKNSLQVHEALKHLYSLLIASQKLDNEPLKKDPEYWTTLAQLGTKSYVDDSFYYEDKLLLSSIMLLACNELKHLEEFAFRNANLKYYQKSIDRLISKLCDLKLDFSASVAIPQTLRKYSFMLHSYQNSTVLKESPNYWNSLALLSGAALLADHIDKGKTRYLDGILQNAIQALDRLKEKKG